ncbi:MAG: enoyl-CoA hydratase/isomerase family protein [Polaromonas sp.]|nr:enoyl-CoA hydratase/isomerase family protein [Polaromonas sp.]
MSLKSTGAFVTIAVDVSAVVSDGILKVSLNRPDKRNAISTQMRVELQELFKVAATEPEVKAIVLSAEGPSFSGGNDLADMAYTRDGDLLSMLEHVTQRPKLFEMVWKCPKPVIAAVHSHCLGASIELVSACDLVVCSDDAKFGWPELRGGAFAPTIWPISMPINRVKEYLLTGRLFGAQEALQVGVVNRVVPKSELYECAYSLALNVSSTVNGYATFVKLGLNHIYEGLGVNQSIEYARQMNVMVTKSAGAAEFWKETESAGKSASQAMQPSEAAQYWKFGNAL